MNNITLPTIFYPYPERKNYRYCYLLSNGKWFIEHRVNLYEMFKMGQRCAKLNIPFRCEHLGINFKLGMEIALNFTCSLRGLSDRRPKVNNNKKIV
jgi:hypothetical protein